MIIWKNSKRYKSIYKNLEFDFKINPKNEKIRKTFFHYLISLNARDSNQTT